MKKLMVSAFVLAMMTTGAMAGEQLTTSQLDQVTAGFFDTQRNRNRTTQIAVALSSAEGGCAFCSKSGNAFSTAIASNSNVTGQANVD